jgi:hypothetical protein
MKLLVLLVCLAVGAVVYPRYAEHTDDVCGALGKRLELLAHAGRGRLPPISYGDVARATMQAQFPAVPEVIRCTVGYWMIVMDPDVGDVAKRLAPFMAAPK